MEKKNLRTCVGGILILAAGILGIISQLLSFVSVSLTYGGSMPAALSATYIKNIVTTILTTLPVIALGVLLMMKKRGILITILSGIMLVLSLYSLVVRIIAVSQLDASTTISTNWLGYVFTILAYASLTVLSIISTNPQPNIFKKLWFLPGVCYGVYAVTGMITIISSTFTASTGYLDPSFLIGFIIGTVIASLPAYGLYTVGYLLAGRWLINPYKKGYRPQPQYQPQPQYAQYQQPQQYQPYGQPQQPQYDEQTTQALNYYKWQYESGAITWEQYNASVQQLLGR